MVSCSGERERERADELRDRDREGLREPPLPEPGVAERDRSAGVEEGSSSVSDILASINTRV